MTTNPRNSLRLLLLLILCGWVVFAGFVAAIWALGGNVIGNRVVDIAVDAEGIHLDAGNDSFSAREVIGEVEASGRSYLVTSVGRAVEALSAVAVATALGLAVNSARHGDPFVAANLSRLRIATVAPILGFAGSVVVSLGHVMATDDAGFVGQTSIGFGWLMVALIFAALSEVWRIGLRLREDAELTI